MIPQERVIFNDGTVYISNTRVVFKGSQTYPVSSLGCATPKRVAGSRLWIAVLVIGFIIFSTASSLNLNSDIVIGLVLFFASIAYAVFQAVNPLYVVLLEGTFGKDTSIKRRNRAYITKVVSDISQAINEAQRSAIFNFYNPYGVVIGENAQVNQHYHSPGREQNPQVPISQVSYPRTGFVDRAKEENSYVNRGGFAMDVITTILNALTAGVTAATQAVGNEAITTLFAAFQERIRKRLAGKPEAQRSLIEQEPAKIHPALMKQWLIEVRADQDEELKQLAQQILSFTRVQQTRSYNFNGNNYGPNIGDNNSIYQNFNFPSEKTR